MTTASIIPELAQFGPDAAGPPPTLEESSRYVTGLTTSHYENFSVLSRLVPQRLRADFAAVYAYCRWSDDLGDETGADAQARQRSLDLLAWWRRQLEACFRFAADPGEPAPRHPVFVVLAQTIRSRSLPPEPFHHLIDAFEQDQRVRRYDTWEDVVQYCKRSADPVGRIVLALDGRLGHAQGDDRLFAMSDATCTALQLANFWQDVRRDLIERDRIYIPLRETGLTQEQLVQWVHRSDDPEARVPFIRAMRPLVERTRALFHEGRPLPNLLASDLSPVIWLFGKGGESVLDATERIGCATLWTRPRLGRARKASLVAAAGMLKLIGRWGRSRAGVGIPGVPGAPGGAGIHERQ